jgi:hypothetical protein
LNFESNENRFVEDNSKGRKEDVHGVPMEWKPSTDPIHGIIALSRFSIASQLVPTTGYPE